MTDSTEYQERELVVEDDPCPICGHDWGSHLLKLESSDLSHGEMFCPEEGCGCADRWTLQMVDGKLEVVPEKEEGGES